MTNAAKISMDPDTKRMAAMARTTADSSTGEAGLLRGAGGAAASGPRQAPARHRR